MTDRQRNVRVRLTSESDNAGYKSAEASAKVLERELNKLEQQQRRQVQMQMAAAKEMAAAEAQKAEAVVAANRRQADAMEAFGKRTLLATAALAVGLGLTAKAAIDWESAWAGVTKTVDGTPEELDQLEGSLRQLARTLPATHEEIAAVAEAAGQLGVKREDVASFTKTMIDLGETTNLSADQAATSLAQFINITGESTKHASQLGAAIVALGNDGASTEADIVSMGLRIAGAGRTVGLTAPQILGLASALSSVGLEAEAGGTAISKVMTTIDSDVKSGSDSLQAYAEIAGVSATKFAEMWRKDATGALTLFIKGLGEMQRTGKDTTATLNDLGFADVRVADTLRRAALSGDLMTKSIKLGTEAYGDNIALLDEANKRYETNASKIQVARNQINDAAIDIGGNFLPAVAGATDVVASLTTGFQALPDTAKSWVAGLGAAAVGLGTLVGGAAVVIPKLHELRITLDEMGGGSSRFGKAIGGVTSLLTGPWGIALAGAALVGGVWLKQQGDAKRRVDELSASLDQQTGAITENTRATAFKSLSDNGTIEKAKSLGLNLEAVLNQAINPTTAGLKELRAAMAENAAGWSDSERDANALAYGDVLRGIGVQGEVVAESQAKVRDQIAAGVGPTEEAAQTTQDYADTLSITDQAAQTAADALDELRDALDNLNDPTLSAREAERQFQAAIDAVTESIETNGTSMDLNTEAGRKNEESLDALARAGQERAQALLDQTGSEEQFRASLDQSRQALHDAAVGFGLSEDAAWAYVDQVLKVPSVVRTQAQLDKDAAQAALDTWIAALQTRVISINVRANLPDLNGSQSGSGRPGLADGSVVEYFRAGGVRSEQHIAQIAPAGSWRVWAEPETGGEAYIPLAQGKRARSEAILEDVASRFGMYVGRYADGAVVGGRSGSSSRQRPTTVNGLVVHGDVVTLDVDELVGKSSQKQMDTLRRHGLLDGGSL